jgi:uncharacterized protein YdaU (DUF1376 family)
MSAPSFQFYPADFLADENVVMMSNQEIGCYIKLMCYCWREGSIPSDLGRIARLCGEDGSAMADLWLAIGSCFEIAIDDPNRLVHPRLVKERSKQIEHKKERADSGRKGAESRWNKASKANSSAIAQPLAEPIANDGFSSSSSTSVINSSNEELGAIKEPPPQPSTPKEKTRRGTKLPVDFNFPSDWFSEALKEMRCSVEAVESDRIGFIDYYTNGDGKNKSRIDWLLSWRSWYRKSYSCCSKSAEGKKNGSNQKPDNSVPAQIARSIAERNARRQAQSAGPSSGDVIEGEFERAAF